MMALGESICPSLTEIIADGTGSYSIYGDIIRDRLIDVKYLAIWQSR